MNEPAYLDQDRFRRELAQLGIQPGDTLYVRAALATLGTPDWRSVVSWFTDYLGDVGTLLVPAFTASGHLFQKNYPIFDQSAVPNSGALSKLALKHPGAKRSAHPTHSFVAIGRRADELLQGHDENASSFLPVRRIAEREGKLLLMGCNRESPGFSTVHCVQYDLGLSQQHLIRYLRRVNLRNADGSLRAWTMKESPGCSISFDKFYPAYIKNENFHVGKIGEAWSIVVDAPAAYASEMAILKSNPRFVDCGRPTCLTCGFRTYQWWRIPRTCCALGWELVKKLTRRRA